MAKGGGCHRQFLPRRRLSNIHHSREEHHTADDIEFRLFLFYHLVGFDLGLGFLSLAMSP